MIDFKNMKLEDGTRFKYINETDNKYIITEEGRVFSLIGNIKERKQKIHKKGYAEITLFKNKKQYTLRIHRIVAEAFVHNPEPALYNQVDHKDMNKLNNHYSNLRWCTNKMNVCYYHANKNNQDENEFMKQKELKKLQVESNKMVRRINNEIKQKRKIENKKKIEESKIPVMINGVKYSSVREAARYISNQEPERKYETIRKSIQNIVKGKEKPRTMYGKYDVNPI